MTFKKGKKKQKSNIILKIFIFIIFIHVETFPIFIQISWFYGLETRNIYTPDRHTHKHNIYIYTVHTHTHIYIYIYIYM